jgi:hypothetical protein
MLLQGLLPTGGDELLGRIGPRVTVVEVEEQSETGLLDLPA